MATLPDRLVLTLLRLYPRSWRARYEAEFRALVADTPVGWRKVLDVARAIGPEWARALRAALVDVDSWRVAVRPVRRFVLAAVVAWALACAVEVAEVFRVNYGSSVWQSSVGHVPTQKEIDLGIQPFAKYISPDRQEIALSYQYARTSAGFKPAEAVLVRPCCSLELTWRITAPTLGGLLVTMAVFGWYASGTRLALADDFNSLLSRLQGTQLCT